MVASCQPFGSLDERSSSTAVGEVPGATDCIALLTGVVFAKLVLSSLRTGVPKPTHSSLGET